MMFVLYQVSFLPLLNRKSYNETECIKYNFSQQFDTLHEYHSPSPFNFHSNKTTTR